MKIWSNCHAPKLNIVGALVQIWNTFVYFQLYLQSRSGMLQRNANICAKRLAREKNEGNLWAEWRASSFLYWNPVCIYFLGCCVILICAVSKIKRIGHKTESVFKFHHLIEFSRQSTLMNENNHFSNEFEWLRCMRELFDLEYFMLLHIDACQSIKRALLYNRFQNQLFCYIIVSVA